jgi:adenylate cyclase class 2
MLSEVEIVASLAARVLPSGPIDWERWKNHRTLRAEMARVVPGYQALDAIDATKREFTLEGRIRHTPRFDTPDGRLGRAGTALRLRRDHDRAVLTVKGPVLPGPVKSREELETSIGDARIAEAMLASLGFVPYFRAQKYREEYVVGATDVMVDDAPVGVFVEIEGTPEEISRVSALLGRTPADYRLESYMGLWRRRCHDKGMSEPADMLFDGPVTE